MKTRTVLLFLLLVCIAFGQNYVPVYDNTGIGVIKPATWWQRMLSGFTITQVLDPIPASPYCLTLPSAQQLVAILPDYQPLLIPKPALGDWPPGPFTQVGNVPWLHINSGSTTIEVNAGLIASYWSHGYSEDYARSQARMDLNMRIMEVRTQGVTSQMLMPKKFAKMRAKLAKR